jgi:glycosyltransferase involved in cell wall biosynthesis
VRAALQPCRQLAEAPAVRLERVMTPASSAAYAAAVREKVDVWQTNVVPRGATAPGGRSRPVRSSETAAGVVYALAPAITRMRLSIIIPFHGRLDQLCACVGGLVPMPPDAELIVVANGARENCRPVVERAGGRVVELPEACGPAVARNRGAEVATGDVLAFVDSDIVVRPGVLPRLLALFAQRPDVAAAFGSYDERPGDAGFMSQYKNLGHAYIHEQAHAEAQTFWGGLGAVRASAFAAVGGFDERFRRASVEDIDLGYRLRQNGYRILVDTGLRGCHLKRWTWVSAIVSDIRDRGVPWTQLLWRFRRIDNDLNVGTVNRISVVLAYVALVSLPLALVDRAFAGAMLVALAVLAALGGRYYLYFRRRKGLLFAARVYPVHICHYLCSGLSFVIGAALYAAARAGVRLPGALPPDRWEPQHPEWTRSLSAPTA